MKTTSQEQLFCISKDTLSTNGAFFNFVVVITYLHNSLDVPLTVIF